MTVGIVGDGVAVEAIRAALDDVDADVTSIDVDDLGAEDLAVVVGQAGAGTFERANERALEIGRRWVAVELGGVGGYPVVDAAVAGFGPEYPCYECLRGRVAANVDPEADPVAAPPARTARFAGALAGREIATHLVDDQPGIFGRVHELPTATRRLLPLPHCSCDTDADEGSGDVDSFELTAGSRELSESLSLAEGALDERVGIVQEVGEAESVPLPYYLARSCDTTGFSDASAARDAAGVAPGWDEAFMKALGEALERYSAGVYRESSFTHAVASDLPDPVDPSAFVAPASPDPGAELAWVDGIALDTGETVQLPAERVHYPPPSRLLGPATTTGLGLGNSTVEATLAGLYEVLERDATMIAWYSSYDSFALSVDDEDYDRLVRRARAVDLSVTTVLVTQDVDIPVVTAAVHREEWPRFAVGSSADLDPANAATDALNEALQNWMELRSMGREAAADASGAIGEYSERPDAAEEFLTTNTSIRAASLRGEDVPTGEEALEALEDRIAEVGLRAYVVPVTPRDVAHLGFEAVRVVVPAAQPLFFGDAYFGDRATSVPTELGFEHRPDRAHHPYP